MKFTKLLIIRDDIPEDPDIVFVQISRAQSDEAVVTINKVLRLRKRLRRSRSWRWSNNTCSCSSSTRRLSTIAVRTWIHCFCCLGLLQIFDLSFQLLNNSVISRVIGFNLLNIPYGLVLNRPCSTRIIQRI